ncbi:hypothetical protein Asppvi_001427 [Aspergillus pseudoviridinutans]|uniref:Uncharacterized protein n=1 Tax=Aspergillus pseudoviridinutans TaxID=1517512 RepID=A0A9P3EQM7_9EURO|nr:uncharacterized protein Asppvi_001427 [Aspergillus pseudoviridinutans]GIJ82912.1 hypothetical protein Asppvi_001427 [Aspergillus pseudoviridinutans]
MCIDTPSSTALTQPATIAIHIRITQVSTGKIASQTVEASRQSSPPTTATRNLRHLAPICTEALELVAMLLQRVDMAASTSKLITTTTITNKPPAQAIATAQLNHPALRAIRPVIPVTVTATSSSTGTIITTITSN